MFGGGKASLLLSERETRKRKIDKIEGRPLFFV
jgi:hypothetical protein